MYYTVSRPDQMNVATNLAARPDDHVPSVHALHVFHTLLVADVVEVGVRYHTLDVR
jgi:hypothetical protein